MESEKVKEIKKALKYLIDKGLVMGENTMIANIKLANILTLINELEKENKTKTDTIIDLLKKQEFYEKEKLKQFAKRLKEKGHERDYAQGYAEIGLCEEIDETLKEFADKGVGV